MYTSLAQRNQALILSVPLALILLLTACGGSNNTTTTPSAQQLLSDAQLAIQKVTSYHFNLDAQNPGSTGSLVVQSADGDIVTPDKLKADAKASTLGNIVQVKFVSIKDKQYVTNPLTETWMPTSGLLDPRTLSNPQTGVGAILGQIQNPSSPKDDSIDGTTCWSIDGTLDTKALTAITAGGTPAGTTVATTTCIGKQDKLPYLIRIKGTAVQGDSDNTVRTFKLSKFGESVTIEAPI